MKYSIDEAYHSLYTSSICFSFSFSQLPSLYHEFDEKVSTCSGLRNQHFWWHVLSMLIFFILLQTGTVLMFLLESLVCLIYHIWSLLMATVWYALSVLSICFICFQYSNAVAYEITKS